MGFESFHADLLPRHATLGEADAAVRRLPGAWPDADALATRGSTYYTVEDGSHVFEIEVTREPVRVSCRFTLCHPPTVDAAFLDLLRDLTRRLGGAEITGEGLTAEVESPEFAAALSARVAERRAEWDKMFGSARAAATTAEAFERYILPKCVPVAGPALTALTAAPPAPTTPAPSS